MARVVIVGAGMGGLAAAARLARVGHDVTVCEKTGRHGGMARGVTRGGFAFDIGPSTLTLPAVYRDLFLKTGGKLEKAVDLVPVDPAVRYRLPDGTWLDLPNASHARLTTAIGDTLGETAAADWNRLMSRANAMWSLVRTPFVESAPEGYGTLLGLARTPGALRTLAPGTTLTDLARAHLRDTRLRAMLASYALGTGSDPRRAPAAVAVLPYIEQTFGVWYVLGGMHQLADALYARCLERGVTFRFGTAATELIVEGNHVAGVQLADEKRLTAEVVVSGVPALHGEDTYERLRRGRWSLSAFTVLLALRGRTPGLPHQSVLLSPDGSAESHALFGRHPRPASDPTIRITAPDDPATRPDDGHEGWAVHVTAPRQGDHDWTVSGVPESYADEVLAVLARRGLDVRDRLLWRVIRTPADIESETGAPGGATHGLAWHGAATPFRRPGNQARLTGLFRVGAETHPGGGLPFVGMSAALVADMIGKA